MSELAIKPAVRSGIRPLVGLSGVSGGGKTRSALLLARGIAGPNGRIVLVDSETGRGSIFADKIPGGYNVLNIDEPFTSERYAEAFGVAEQNSDITVIDSISHEWLGVLEAHELELDRMAGQDWKKRDQCKFTAWIKPKTAHKVFLTKILRAKIPVIVCFRAEPKTHIGKKEGKTVVTVSELPEPIFDPRFFFECLVCADVYSQSGVGGFLHITKITTEDLFECLPKEGEQIGIKHGELMAKWSLGGAATTPVAESKKLSNGLREIKSKLWALTQPIHQAQPGDSKELLASAKQRLSQYLWDESLLADTESLDELSETRLSEVLGKIEGRMKHENTAA